LVQINWANPITRGLRILDGGNITVANYDPRLQKITANNITARGTSLGLANSGTQGRRFAVFDLSVTQAVTMFSIGRFATSSVANNTPLVLKAGGFNGATWVGVHGGSFFYRQYYVAGNTTSYGLDYTVPSSSVREYAAQAVTASASGGVVAYLNGAVVGTGSISGGLVTRTDIEFSTIAESYGGIDPVVYPVDLLIGAVFDRALSSGEIQSLSQNPWQLFAPDPSPTFNYLLPSSPSAVQTKTLLQLSKRALTTQPPAAVGANWGNPLTNGLEALTLASQRLEVVKGRIGTTTGPFEMRVASSLRTSGGLARRYQRASNQSRDNWPTTGVTGDLTFLCYGLLFQSLSAIQELCSLRNNASGLVVSFQENSNNQVTLLVTPSGAATLSIGFGSANINTGARVFIGRVAGTAVTAWFDGRQVGSGTAASNNFSTITGLQHGSQGFLSEPNGAVLISAYWKRALGDGEIQSLSANPWQLFRPQSQIIYSRISVKPTLSDPAATSITSSSATPQVTLNL
jgi:hypothetical protein